MPLLKCTECHHEWESAAMFVDRPCDWCEAPGAVIEQTALERMLSSKISDRVYNGRRALPEELKRLLVRLREEKKNTSS